MVHQVPVTPPCPERLLLGVLSEGSVTTRGVKGPLTGPSFCLSMAVSRPERKPHGTG